MTRDAALPRPKRVRSRASGTRHAKSAAGFTLVELLVALTGGLFVSITVFALARDATRFYQREGRLASATLAAVVGFERLRSDIARAGFLVSPNVQSDPYVCTRPDATAPLLLQNLATLRITPGGSPSNTTLAANGIAPDQILLMGSYSSADEFPIRAIPPPADGSATVIYLEPDSGAMARLGWASLTDDGDRARLLSSVFAPKRALRIIDSEGRQHYGVITKVSATGGQPVITLGPIPALQFRATASKLCGIKSYNVGGTASVINFVTYDVRNLKDKANYSALYNASSNTGTAAWEKDRTELVRRELGVDGTLLSLNETLADGSTRTTELEELVAEYAVNLRFELTVVNSAPGVDPTLAHLSTAGDYTPYAVTLPSAGGTPQRIRAVRASLSVRSREPDREMPIIDPNITNAGAYRIGLGSSASGAAGPYARLRTLQADVMLQNNSNVRW